MKSIYDLINENKQGESVFKIMGPDDTIISVASTKEEAEEIVKLKNKEAGGNVFSYSQENSSDFMK